MKSFDSYVVQAVKIFGLLVLLAGIGTAAATIGWQAFIFLRLGKWIPVSVFDLISYFSADAADALFPDRWIGLASIISWPNGGIVLMAVSTLIGAKALSIEEIDG